MDDNIINIDDSNIRYINCNKLELWIPETEEEREEIIENKDICNDYKTKRCNECSLRVYGILKLLIPIFYKN